MLALQVDSSRVTYFTYNSLRNNLGRWMRGRQRFDSPATSTSSDARDHRGKSPESGYCRQRRDAGFDRHGPL